MSDAVIISLIGAIGSCVAASLSGIAVTLSKESIRRSIKNAESLSDTRNAMVTLEKNTNSIKDDLVRITGESEFAKGLKQGTESNKP